MALLQEEEDEEEKHEEHANAEEMGAQWYSDDAVRDANVSVCGVSWGIPVGIRFGTPRRWRTSV